MQSREYPEIGEKLYEATLPNGLRIRVVPKAGFSSFFAAFAVNYGGAHRRFELDGKKLDTPAGIAHFLEHKMFDMPSGDSAINILTANGADPNAFTSEDVTCYYFECTHSFEENLRLLLRFVSTPYFTAETVQKEQGIIGQEIRMGEDDPGDALYYNLYKLLYPEHPVKDRIAGTVESIAEISDKTLYDCYNMFYRPSNMILSVAGDVDPERVMKIAEEELSSTLQSVPVADFPEFKNMLPAESLISENMEVSAPQFMIGAKMRPEKEGDKALRQDLVAKLSLRLLAGYSSPLYTKLYSAGLLSRNFDYECNVTAGTGALILGGESPKPMEVLKALNLEVERINREGLDSERFERAKRASLGARLRGLEDFENVCVSLIFCLFEGYCAFDALKVLGSITKEECEEFIREHFAPERLAVSIIEAKRS